MPAGNADGHCCDCGAVTHGRVQVVYHTDFLFEPTPEHPYAPQYHWRTFHWIYPRRCPTCTERYVAAHYLPPGILI